MKRFLICFFIVLWVPTDGFSQVDRLVFCEFDKFTDAEGSGEHKVSATIEFTDDWQRGLIDLDDELFFINFDKVRSGSTDYENHIATGNYTVFATAISEEVDGDIDSMHFMLDTSFGKDKTARMSMHMRYDGIIDWAIIEGTCSGLCEGNCFRRLMMD